MKSAPIIVAAIALLACSQAEPFGPSASPPSPPTANPPATPPSNPPRANTGVMIWVMVLDANGSCIPGARVQVVAGQATGEPITQETPCGVWDYGGGVEFQGLTAGVSMTLRATATGYGAEEMTVYPYDWPRGAIRMVLHPKS